MEEYVVIDRKRQTVSPRNFPLFEDAFAWRQEYLRGIAGREPSCYKAVEIRAVAESMPKRKNEVEYDTLVSCAVSVFQVPSAFEVTVEQRNQVRGWLYLREFTAGCECEDDAMQARFDYWCDTNTGYGGVQIPTGFDDGEIAGIAKDLCRAAGFSPLGYKTNYDVMNGGPPHWSYYKREALAQLRSERRAARASSRHGQVSPA